MSKEWQTLDDFMKEACESCDRQAWHDGKELVRNYGLEGDFKLTPSFIHSPGYGCEMTDSTYWTEYAQQTAEDLGLVQEDSSWPNMYIDWDRAADALAMDYCLETVGGYDYYVRER